MIKLIRGSDDPDAARQGLIDKFELSEEQAQAILDMRLQRLTALESDKVRTEHAELVKGIKELRAILETRHGSTASSSTSSARSRNATATSAGPRSPSPRARSTSRT